MMFSATKNDIDTSRCYIGSEDLVDCILTLESSLDEDNPSQSENIQWWMGSNDNKGNESSKSELFKATSRPPLIYVLRGEFYISCDYLFLT